MNRFCLLILSLALVLWGQDGKPNFSGTWDLQVAKSDFGPLPAPESQTHTIEHKDPKLKMTTASKGAQGDFTIERNLTTDGVEASYQAQERPWKTKVRRVEKTLVLEHEFELEGNKIQIKDTWSLADDGKALQSERVLNSSFGEANQKLVFTKK